MRIMRVDGKYRILADGSHLPEEIPQEEANEALSRLGAALQALRDALSDIHRGSGALGDVVAEAMESACLDYDDGRERHLDCLTDAVEAIRERLAECDDDIPSYEDSETVLDAGYRAETYGHNAIYVRVIEDSDEREVVEEVVLRDDGVLHRMRTTIWEEVPGGRHSKEIRYEDLPLDERLGRLARNTMAASEHRR